MSFDAIKDWLARQALLATPVPRITAYVAEALFAAGLPILRMNIGASALHPEVESVSVTWRRGEGAAIEVFGHGAFEAVRETSPYYGAVRAAQQAAAAGLPLTETPMTRYRIEHGEGLAFTLLGRLQREGAADYICFILMFGRDGRPERFLSGSAVSFTTDRPGGFTDAEIEGLAGLMPALGAALRVAAQSSTTEALLDTYLGRDVGLRVLNGEIRRGSYDTISAAILFADLRGFTALADKTPAPALLAMLDAYFDILVGAVETQRGHVLKFLGDGLLATFADDGDGAGCALSAAEVALANTDAVNAERRRAALPHAGIDIALHAGDVLFGNVGADRRLDFTIVGPAVNEAARMEALCAQLGVPLIASSAFVERLGRPAQMRSLGPQSLRGVARPVEVFTRAS